MENPPFVNEFPIGKEISIATLDYRSVILFYYVDAGRCVPKTSQATHGASPMFYLCFNNNITQHASKNNDTLDLPPPHRIPVANEGSEGSPTKTVYHYLGGD